MDVVHGTSGSVSRIKVLLPPDISIMVAQVQANPELMTSYRLSEGQSALVES